MKYAASNSNSTALSQAGQSPWVNITQNAAKTACANLGAGYHLTTNVEWMTIAANAAKQTFNWSGGAVGSGTLVQGHSNNSPASVCASDVSDSKAWVGGSDCTGQTQGTMAFNQRRTAKLSNSEVIWDFAGNAWQWVDVINTNDKPTPASDTWQQFPTLSGTTTMPLAQLVPINAVQNWWTDSWNSAQSIGRFYSGYNGSGGALQRGGAVDSGTANAGLFSGRLSNAADYADGFGTFRCTWAP